MQPSPTLALVSRAGTGARSAGWAIRLRKLKMSDASSRPPGVETALRWVLSEDIVKFGMGFLGKRITPGRRPLLVLRAAQMERARLMAWPHQCLAWLLFGMSRRRRSSLQSSP